MRHEARCSSILDDLVKLVGVLKCKSLGFVAMYIASFEDGPNNCNLFIKGSY